MAKLKRTYGSDKEGKKMPSVTEIISRHLAWKSQGLYKYYFDRGRSGEPMNAHRDSAAAKGSRVHDLVARHFDPANHSDVSEWTSSEIDEATPNANRVIAAIEAKKWQILYVEEKLWSESFAGTPDMVARDLDGNIMIVDLKTSKGTYPETVIQLGGYAWLHRIRCINRNEIELFATHGAVVHAPYGGEMSIIPVTPAALVAGEQVFRLLLQIHEIQHAIVLGDV